MTDSYVQAVNSGFTKTLAKKLGLPRPAVLRRFRAGDPLTVGPVLVLGGTPGVRDDADLVAEALLAWDLDVRQTPDDTTRWGAVVVVLSGIERPQDASAPVMALSATLRRLAPNGRVVTISRAPPTPTPRARRRPRGRRRVPAVRRQELRYGATANGVQVTDDAPVDSPSVLATLRFFLSAKSAFVDGQLLRVGPSASDSASGSGSADLDQPLAGKVAVVTGAARGIGAQVARTLARDGAKVVVVDVPAAGEALARVANEIKGTALQLDVTADDAGARILEHARARHGGLDVLVHNAGILRDKLLANMSPTSGTRWSR